jgi:hypothetical protein
MSSQLRQENKVTIHKDSIFQNILSIRPLKEKGKHVSQITLLPLQGLQRGVIISYEENVLLVLKYIDLDPLATTVTSWRHKHKDIVNFIIYFFCLYIYKLANSHHFLLQNINNIWYSRCHCL